MSFVHVIRGALVCGVVGALSAVVPTAVQAQPSGKWVATIPTLTNGGAADLTVESRNDKQSRAKISFRNARSNVQLAWNIAVGNCRDEGAPVAPQAAFNPVQTQMDGGGTASGTIPKLEPGKKYYVRVFDPQSMPTDGSLYGCANMSEKP
jgi:hypothetical protein